MVPIRQLQGILFRLNELEAASNFSRTQSIRLSRYQPSMIVSRRLSTRDLELTSSFSITSAQQGNFEKPRRVCHACRGFCHSRRMTKHSQPCLMQYSLLESPLAIAMGLVSSSHCSIQFAFSVVSLKLALPKVQSESDYSTRPWID